MRYFTEVEIPEFPVKLDYTSKILMMGSCFVEEIGGILKKLKFNVDLNPSGILYNPVSIANSLKILLKTRYFNSSDLFFNNGLWFSFLHHGRFSSTDQTHALNQMNSRIKTGSENLRNATYLFLTFGTAWVYELKSTGQVVSNCHKVPENEFRRYRLPVDEITEVYSDILEEIWQINSDLKIVFTISPIRHWKDGAVENQVSKATLLLAVNYLIGKYQGRCLYFPSYEIVMDELRDYRFYAPDMLHLSETAVNHIWKKFEAVMVKKEAKEISKKILQVMKDMEHRPFNQNTSEFRKFIFAGLRKVNSLTHNYPFLDLIKEKEYFEKQLNHI